MGRGGAGREAEHERTDAVMRVLIVDDEQRICTLIKKLIHWEGLGLSLCGTYQSAAEALERLERDGADILICDIEMPEMSGLELLRRVRAAAPACRTIIVSGYRNFEYAHEAMKLGVFRYILKPIDETELNDVLAELAGSIGEEAAHRQNAAAERRSGLWTELMSGDAAPDMAACNQRYGYAFRPGRFVAARVFFPESPETAPAGRQFSALYESAMKTRLGEICWDMATFSGPEGTYSVLNYKDTPDAAGVLDSALHDVLAELHGKTQCEFFVSLGRPETGTEDLPRGRRMADAAMWRRMAERHSAVFYGEEADLDAMRRPPPGLSPEEKQSLTAIIEQIQSGQLPQWVRGCFDAHRAELDAAPQLYLNFARSLMIAMLNQLYNMEVQTEIQEQARMRTERCIHQAVGREELIAQLSALMTEILDTVLRPKEDNVDMYVEKAKAYIKRHYMEEITLDALAGELNLNASYLSALFKNVMQINYSKYLTGVRMDEAKRLLRNTDLNLTQIAQRVGYQNSFYFTRIFTKTAGMKPQEYRRLYQKKENAR